VLVARSAADLARVAGEFRYLEIKTATISSDLSKAGAAQEVFDAMRSQSQKIDFLVNNAGYALYGPFAQSDVVQDLANMQLNMVSLVWDAECVYAGCGGGAPPSRQNSEQLRAG